MVRLSFMYVEFFYVFSGSYMNVFFLSFVFAVNFNLIHNDQLYIQYFKRE